MILKVMQNGFIFKNIAIPHIIKKFNKYLKNKGQTPVSLFKKFISVLFDKLSISMLPEYFAAVKTPVKIANKLIKHKIIIILL